MIKLVQKYGGTSLASAKHIQQIAKHICATLSAGYGVAVVVSAMGDETDRLVDLAQSIQSKPNKRELDALLATGEQRSATLMSMAINALGYESRSYAGWQLPITTDGDSGCARIVEINTDCIIKDLKNKVVPVISGFQGVDKEGNLNTLGRGGSDTSAVALAVALGSCECQIYTDVAGVYTADPRQVKEAQSLKTIMFEEMLELSGQGAKVLHPRAVQMAGWYRVPLRVLPSADPTAEGTLMQYDKDFIEGNAVLLNLDKKSMTNHNDIQNSGTHSGACMEPMQVSGISYNNNEAKIDVIGVPNKAGSAARLLGSVAQNNINVDMIVQSTAKDGVANLSFTVLRDDAKKVADILREVGGELSECSVEVDADIAKVSVVGSGMRDHAGVASLMFEALGNKSINIELISTSEIKVAVVIAKKHLNIALTTLHKIFGLGEKRFVETDIKTDLASQCL